MSDYRPLYEKIEYTFKDESILGVALTHSSYGETNYERMEFLGDALLDFAIGEYLYRLYPDKAEGELTKLRAQMVSNAVLCKVFDQLGLVKYIVSQNLATSHLSEKTRANFIESLLAAVYLDGGMDAAVRFVYKFIVFDAPVFVDYISKLYEYCAIRKLDLDVVEENVGTVKAPRFAVTVKIEGQVVAEGVGDSIKHAKQTACRIALTKC